MFHKSLLSALSYLHLVFIQFFLRILACQSVGSAFRLAPAFSVVFFVTAVWVSELARLVPVDIFFVNCACDFVFPNIRIPVVRPYSICSPRIWGFVSIVGVETFAFCDFVFRPLKFDSSTFSSAFVGVFYKASPQLFFSVVVCVFRPINVVFGMSFSSMVSVYYWTLMMWSGPSALASACRKSAIPFCSSNAFSLPVLLCQETSTRLVWKPYFAFEFIVIGLISFLLPT